MADAAGIPCRWAAGIITPNTRCIAIVWSQSPQSLKKRQVQVHLFSLMNTLTICPKTANQTLTTHLKKCYSDPYHLLTEQFSRKVFALHSLPISAERGLVEI